MMHLPSSSVLPLTVALEIGTLRVGIPPCLKISITRAHRAAENAQMPSVVVMIVAKPMVIVTVEAAPALTEPFHPTLLVPTAQTLNAEESPMASAFLPMLW